MNPVREITLGSPPLGEMDYTDYLGHQSFDINPSSRARFKLIVEDLDSGNA